MSSLVNTLRGAEQYFVEISLAGIVTSSVGLPDTIDFPNKISVDVTSLVRETVTSKGQAKIYNFSVCDFFLKRAKDFDEVNREPLVLSCPDLSQGRTRFLTIFSGDSGIALSGSNAATLQTLPNTLIFTLGKINLFNPNDTKIYHPNTDLLINGEPSADQRVVSCLIRFSLLVSYL